MKWKDYFHVTFKLLQLLYLRECSITQWHITLLCDQWHIMFLPFPLTFRQEHFCFSEGSITPFGRKHYPEWTVSVWILCSEECPLHCSFSSRHVGAEHMDARLRTHHYKIKSQWDRQLHWAVLSCTVKRCVAVCIAFCSFCSLQENLHSEAAISAREKQTNTRRPEAISEDQ